MSVTSRQKHFGHGHHFILLDNHSNVLFPRGQALVQVRPPPRFLVSLARTFRFLVGLPYAGRRLAAAAVSAWIICANSIICALRLAETLVSLSSSDGGRGNQVRAWQCRRSAPTPRLQMRRRVKRMRPDKGEIPRCKRTMMKSHRLFRSGAENIRGESSLGPRCGGD